MTKKLNIDLLIEAKKKLESGVSDKELRQIASKAISFDKMLSVNLEQSLNRHPAIFTSEMLNKAYIRDRF